MNDFKEMNFDDFNFNPFTKIGKEWMLITAGTKDKINTMTASWGSLGVMWGKNVAFTFIRPQRYTKEFIDNNETFSLCFFTEEFKKDLSYLGSVSGKAEDKISKTNLTSDFINNTPYFVEASLVFICKKLYMQNITSNGFIIPELNSKWYENNDYHTMYVSEIQKIYSK